MSIIYIISGLVAAVLMVYLLAALVLPERFS